MSGHPVKAFDTAYPGSMCERADGYYIERNDHKSMAAALVELIASRDREIEDLRDAVAQLKRFLAVAPDLLAELERSIEREYNPFEPDNQSARYLRMKALHARATGATP